MPLKNSKLGNELKLRFLSVVLSLVSLCACVFAWFITGNEMTVKDLSFETSEYFGFQVSLDGEEYHSDASMSFPDNLELRPVSGTGELLYDVILPQGSSSATVVSDGLETLSSDCVWNLLEYSAETDAVNKFLKFRLYVRCSEAGDVALDYISVCSPSAEFENRQNTDKSKVVRPATGNFVNKVVTENGENYITKDYICAATRLLFVSDDGLKSIVVPNDRYTLTTTTVSDGVKLSLDENDTSSKSVEKVYYLENGTPVLRSYVTVGYTTYLQSQINDDEIAAAGQTKKTTRIASLDYNPDGAADYKYEAYLDIYLWIEGFDNEAVTYFEDGQLQVTMKFNHVVKEQ